jgi:protocatechuate 3,4-dioxygenase beta subunit
MLFVHSHLSAQSPGVCSVGVGVEPKAKTALSTPAFSRELVFMQFASWRNPAHVFFNDRQYASVQLDGNKFSRVLRIRNFRNNIPPGSVIHGITLNVYGKSDNALSLDENVIALTGPDGVRKGGNKANAAWLQKPWMAKADGSDGKWCYGGPKDVWGTTWTAEEVNHPDFGVEIQLRNMFAQAVSVQLDHVEILIHYTPPYSFCDGRCLTFYVDKFREYSHYVWHVPVGFDIVSTQNNYTIDLNVDGAAYGLYEICADIYNVSGQLVEQCCRPFLYTPCNTASIEGEVWTDHNANKIKDASDGRLPGLELLLYDTNQVMVQKCTTDLSGKFRFENLEPGLCYIKAPVLNNSNLILKSSTPGNTGSEFSNSNGAGTSDFIQLVQDQQLSGFDLGYTPLITLGDFVWEDKNYNGLQDEAETGIAGVEVQLLSNTGTTLQTTLTDMQGKYSFNQLPANDYRLYFRPDEDYLPTYRRPQPAGLVSVIGLDGKTDLKSYTAPGTYSQEDAGFFRYACVGDYVWEDLNGDGIQDAGEPGIPGLEVLLEGTAGDGTQIFRITVTDASGKYSFDKLLPGTYTIKVNLPAGLRTGPYRAGTDDTVDNDAVFQEVRDAFIAFVEPFTLMSGDMNKNIDIGVYKWSSVGDLIWEDLNGNGVFEAGEPGIAGVGLTLTGTAGDGSIVLQNTSTDEYGKYLFHQLKPGNYTLTAALPSGYLWVAPNAGNYTELDSDFDPDNSSMSFELLSNTVRSDIDGGAVRMAAIMGVVWEDFNCDGVRTTFEPGVSEVEVKISGTTNQSVNILEVITTDENGNFDFGGLLPGQYQVEVMVPAGFETAASTVFNLQITSGQIANAIEVPLFRKGSISGVAWEDINRDGIRGIQEPLMKNVPVTLAGFTCTGAVNDFVVTDEEGRYHFENLYPGDYILVFDIPDNFSVTLKNAGNDASLDSDIDEFGIVGATLQSGQSIENLDAGFYRDIIPEKGSIGDFVWEDVNGNGLQDPGERGLTNILITLTGTTGQGEPVTAETLTDQNGQYLFADLESGVYELKIELPVWYVLTKLNLSDQERNSDFDPVTLTTPAITLNEGEHRLDIDAGLFSYAILGDRVWLDLNRNGLQDDDEPGVADIIMVLKKAEDDEPLAYSTTDEAGYYFFNSVEPGQYYIEAEDINAEDITEAFVLPEDRNSDFIEINGVVRTLTFAVKSNDFMTDFDLGLLPKTTGRGGFVWLDANNDGIRDSNEMPVEGLIVILADINSEFRDTVTTDNNGSYFFSGLQPGFYTVTFEKLKGTNFTIPAAGSDPERDSDVIDLINGSTDIFEVKSGTSANDISAGFVKQSRIGDFVWLDSNENGLQDEGENGLNNIRIRLFTSSGILVDSTVSFVNPATGLSGYYVFDSLMYGDYYTSFELPQNLEFTVLNLSDNSKNSKVTSQNGPGTTDVFNLPPGEDRMDIDAGYVIGQVVTGSISGVVWLDANNNLIRDEGELKIPGIQVSIFTLSGILVSSSETDENGNYIFADVPFGDYYLSVPVVENRLFVLKNGGNNDLDSDITNAFGPGTTSLITVFPGQNISNIDFGYTEKLSIGDFVWDDLNYNGLQDDGEPGLSQVEIILLNFENKPVISTFSDVNGNYRFEDVPVGVYSLKFGQKQGFLFTLPLQSGAGDNSKADLDGTAGPFDFTIPGNYTDVDAGYVKTASIGRFVWLDLNGNGFRNANEPGIQGIEVKLFNTFGEIVATTISEPMNPGSTTGNYRFSDIRPGTYYLHFDIPSDYILSDANIGDDEFDSDITNAFGRGTTDIFTVLPGESKLNIDAGAYLPATLGDFVWNDLNKNGIQDPDEPGIEGVRVDLYASTGQLVASTTTNEEGIYGFTGLRQRLYYIQFELKPGFRFTLQNVGNDGGKDSDVDETGTTPLISLAHGASFLAADAGMYATEDNIVMGRIWMDENKNGIREPEEILLDSILVALVDDELDMYSTAMTNHAGMYCLATQQTGGFYVKVEPKPSHVFTEYRNGSNPDTIDNGIFEDGLSEMLVFDSKPNLFYVNGGMYYKRFASVQGIVWKDLNNNNILDDTDSRMSDVPVLIFNKSRIFIKSAKTEIDGSFVLNGLEAGEYYCLVPTFADTEFILYNSAIENNYSNITNLFGMGTTRLISIAEGQSFSGFHVGYRQTQNRHEKIQPHTVFNGVKESSSLDIYPNPAFWYINIQNTTGHPADLLIFDQSGRIVRSLRNQKESDMRLEVSELPTGRYHVLLRTKDGDVLSGFVKLDY